MADMNSARFPFHIPENQLPKDIEYYAGLERLFDSSRGTTVDKLHAFPKFAPIADLGRFLAKAEIFKRILPVHGSVVECGVYMGGGVMTWAALSAIYEPLNHVRQVIGFDTFEGFPSVREEDLAAVPNADLRIGGVAGSAEDEIREGIRLFDLYRPLGHIPKVELVKGDVQETVPRYLENNGHLLVALLYLDFDLYEPTKIAIETLIPRMPKGAVIAFDELNVKQWPGEARAVVDSVGIRSLRIERFQWQPQISFAVLE
jgi:hypothetical protein